MGALLCPAGWAAFVFQILYCIGGLLVGNCAEGYLSAPFSKVEVLVQGCGRVWSVVEVSVSDANMHGEAICG